MTYSRSRTLSSMIAECCFYSLLDLTESPQETETSQQVLTLKLHLVL